MKFKKPNFWDLEKPNFISYLLLPFTLPIIINNFFLKKKLIKKSEKIKTICVGNIYLGGTGKTPAVIELYKILNELNLKVSTGKKFYTSHLDEKIILEKKTNFIGAINRKKVLEIAEKNKQEFLIYDDGLQDKSISYHLQFVCFDAKKWIGNGNLIPSGPLREKISSIIKYDAIFLKNYNSNKIDIINLIKKIKSNIEIFSTFYEIVNINKFDLSQDYLIFSGIGNPADFKQTLIKNNFKVVDEIIFPDHFNYKKNDIERIKNYAKKIKAKIITTEKDYVKISKIDCKDIDFLEVNLKIEERSKLVEFLKSKIL